MSTLLQDNAHVCVCVDFRGYQASLWEQFSNQIWKWIHKKQAQTSLKQHDAKQTSPPRVLGANTGQSDWIPFLDSISNFKSASAIIIIIILIALIMSRSWVLIRERSNHAKWSRQRMRLLGISRREAAQRCLSCGADDKNTPRRSPRDPCLCLFESTTAAQSGQQGSSQTNCESRI